jgi:hypothetical protein
VIGYRRIIYEFDFIIILIDYNSPINRSLIYCKYVNISRSKSKIQAFGLYPMNVGYRSNHEKFYVSILLFSLSLSLSLFLLLYIYIYI